MCNCLSDLLARGSMPLFSALTEDMLCAMCTLLLKLRNTGSSDSDACLSKSCVPFVHPAKVQSLLLLLLSSLRFPSNSLSFLPEFPKCAASKELPLLFRYQVLYSAVWLVPVLSKVGPDFKSSSLIYLSCSSIVPDMPPEKFSLLKWHQFVKLNSPLHLQNSQIRSRSAVRKLSINLPSSVLSYKNNVLTMYLKSPFSFRFSIWPLALH